jgi:probable F420-dependent oxidoreductase
MRFSVGIPTCKEGLNFPLPFADASQVIEIIEAAERMDYHSVWGNDHVTAPKYVREAFDRAPRFYEPLITLAYSAACTSTIRLATSVIVLPMREPVYLAKQVATLDVLSGGRMILGVGIGAYREEFERILPDRAGSTERGDMVDESIQALTLLFSEEVASYRGRTYHFEGIALSPKPLQDPLPMYIGGNSRKAAERAGRSGAGWLPASLSTEDIRRGIGIVQRTAEQMGRDPASIDIAPQLMVCMGNTYAEATERFKRSQMYHHLVSLRESTLRDQDLGRIEEYNLVGTPQQVLDKVDQLVRAGVTHCAALNFISQTPAEMIEQMAFFKETVVDVYGGRT